MDNTTLYGIAAVPAILGIVQVAKQSGIPSRLAPLCALVLGIIAGLGQAATGHLDWPTAAATGIVLGLAASGLYAGATTVAGAGKTRNGETTTTPITPAAAAVIAGPLHPPAKTRRHTTRATGGKFTSTTQLPPTPIDGAPPTAR